MRRWPGAPRRAYHVYLVGKLFQAIQPDLHPLNLVGIDALVSDLLVQANDDLTALMRPTRVDPSLVP